MKFKHLVALALALLFLGGIVGGVWMLSGGMQGAYPAEDWVVAFEQGDFQELVLDEIGAMNIRLSGRDPNAVLDMRLLELDLAGGDGGAAPKQDGDGRAAAKQDGKILWSLLIVLTLLLVVLIAVLFVLFIKHKNRTSSLMANASKPAET
jgi:hypothetical protein